MHRRNLLKTTAASLVAAQLAGRFAFAADASQLSSELTPFGAERAASKSGLVPSWTGGVTSPPAGWTDDEDLPDIFGTDTPSITITASNMSQYADMLCAGQIALLKTYGSQGFKLQVYPTRRSAAAAEWVYDNTAKNVSRAQLASVPQNGFTGAFGGTPFPILSEDTGLAGAQVIWNHLTRWEGVGYARPLSSYVVGASGVRTLVGSYTWTVLSPYYDREHSVNDYNHFFKKYNLVFSSPAALTGKEYIVWCSNLEQVNQDQAYVYIVGEGRVHKLPPIGFDDPSIILSNGILNWDEVYGFFGPPTEYNWKLIGKKEMIVPYNDHKLYRTQPSDLLGPHFINPDSTRWEVHRVWVVEASGISSGTMTEPLRRLYFDEDTWAIVMADAYDGSGRLVKYCGTNNEVRPEAPGTIVANNFCYALDTQTYCVTGSFYNTPAPIGGRFKYGKPPLNLFNPQTVSSQARF